MGETLFSEPLDRLREGFGMHPLTLRRRLEPPLPPNGTAAQLPSTALTAPAELPDFAAREYHPVIRPGGARSAAVAC